jgi:RTX calcium-binding nonapeptide repeat (4 copies)
MPRVGECVGECAVVVRQGRLIAVLGVLLIGCAVLLVVGCAGGGSEAPQKEQGRTKATKQEQRHTEATKEQAHSPEATASEEAPCGRTRTVDLGASFESGASALTNDVPGCPNGGLLLGTNKPDKLDAGGGDDEIRGLGAKDSLWGGFGNDVVYGGPGNDFLTGSTVDEDGHDKSKDVLHGGPGRDSVNAFGSDDVLYGGDGDDNNRLYGGKGEDVLYGGDGNDFLDASLDGQRDKLYCGKGKDEYAADKIDHVSSSCEKKVMMGRM